MRIHALLPAVAALALLARTAPQAPEIPLGTRNAAIAEQFSDVVGIAELKDGRVLVTDRVERALLLCDFATGKRKVVGRNGNGPNEYATPFGPINWLGDTLLLYDGNNRRFVKAFPDGTLGNSVAFATSQKPGLSGWAPPAAVDAEGRVYWDNPVLQMQPVIERKMVANIVRWRLGSEEPELVMEFADHGAFEHRFRFRPFPQTDAWVLAPDGRVGIISAAEYRLKWYKDGKVVETGPPIPYTPVKVNAGEREAFIQQKAMEPGSGASMNGGSLPARLGIDRARAAYPDSLFPDVLPPFEIKGALLARNGNIWIRRRSPSTEKSARVDVLDAHGVLRGTVRLGAGHRLLALGTASVYIVAVDDDGLQTLERYAIPAALR